MNLTKISFLNALGTAAYIVVVVLIIFNILDKDEENILTPIFALMLFVTSAAVTGGLVLGRPVMLYLDNQKANAVKLFAYTICWLFGGTIIAFLVNVKY